MSQDILDNRQLSATKPAEAVPSSGVHLYHEVDPSQPADDPVGRPVPHLAALQAATGEAVFVDDMPQHKGGQNCAELYFQRWSIPDRKI